MPTLDRPGGPLHYEVTDVTAPWAGEPETILFHHGVGITGDIWLEWLPPLADRYRLVRLDVRGFGRSSVPGPGFGWSTCGSWTIAIPRVSPFGARWGDVGRRVRCRAGRVDRREGASTDRPLLRKAVR